MQSKNSLPLRDHSIYLNASFLQNPQEMVDEFCENFTLFDSRRKIWEMFLSFCSSEESEGLTRSVRTEYLLFYQALAGMLEATYTLNEEKMRKNEQLRF